jgi:hypothetical protein
MWATLLQWWVPKIVNPTSKDCHVALDNVGAPRNDEVLFLRIVPGGAPFMAGFNPFKKGILLIRTADIKIGL